MNGNTHVPFILGQLKCSITNGLIVTPSLNETPPIHYEISSPLSTFDCSGKRVSYTPNVGIDFYSGKLAGFENFSQEKFCDSTFMIKAQIENDASVTGKRMNLLKKSFFILNMSLMFIFSSIQISSNVV